MTPEEYHLIKPMYPVFVLNKDVQAETYVHFCGATPYANPLAITIPKGTEILPGWTQFPHEGYAMKINNPRQVPGLRGTTNQQSRWFKCTFEDMSYLEHRNMR